MHDKSAEFFAPVMRAIACTPNRNPDLEAYRVGVIEPASKIRALLAACEKSPPTQEQMSEALRLLAGILRAKRLEREEFEERMCGAGQGPALEELVKELIAEA
jgi:hypothetical protein